MDPLELINVLTMTCPECNGGSATTDDHCKECRDLGRVPSLAGQMVAEVFAVWMQLPALESSLKDSDRNLHRSIQAAHSVASRTTDAIARLMERQDIQAAQIEMLTVRSMPD